MEQTTHPDAAHTLRLAIWGQTDDATADAARHAAACPACAAQVTTLRRVRDLMRSGAAAPEPPFELRAAPAGESAPDLCFDWLTATPVAPLAGVRSAAAAAPAHFTCDAGGISLDFVLHGFAQDGSPDANAPGAALSGQALLAGSEPAADAEITLFLDRRPVVSSRTDPFGEFAFDAGRGRRIGVRVAVGTAAHRIVRHIEIPFEAGR